MLINRPNTLQPLIHSWQVYATTVIYMLFTIVIPCLWTLALIVVWFVPMRGAWKVCR